MGPPSRSYPDQGGPQSRDAAVAALAGRRHGVVSTQQLRELGLDADAIRTRVATGRLHRVHRGVYAVGHLALTGRGRELAAVLACGPQALLSHKSAAVLWGVLRSDASRIEVTAPRGRKPQGTILIHRSRAVHPEERAEIDAVPVTSVARMLVDLADVVTEARLAGAVNEAEVLRLFDGRALERTLKRLPGRRGRHRLRRVLAAHESDPAFTRSEAERRFLEVCTSHGLPAPSANAWVAGHEVDFFWPDARLAVEVDGATYHRTARAFHADAGATARSRPTASTSSG